MLCQHCNQNEATTRIRQVVNGVESSLDLCPKCAGELGYFKTFSLFGDFCPPGGLTFDLKSLFGAPWEIGAAVPAQSNAQKRCDFCGSALPEIMSSGRVGCARCYDTFEAELKTVISRMHPSMTHTGKRPGAKTVRLRKKEEPGGGRVTELKIRLEQAVSEENFEEAAKIRDEIRALGGK